MDGTNLTVFAEAQRSIGKELTPRVDVVNMPGDPRGGYVVIERNGGEARFHYQTKPRIRNYKALSLASFAAIVTSFSVGQSASRGESLAETAGTVRTVEKSDKDGTFSLAPPIAVRPRLFVFVGPKSVVALLDEADGIETVRFDLETSDNWKAIERLTDVPDEGDEAGGPFLQKDLIDFLRREVNGEYEPPNIVQKLRAVKFTKAVAGDSTVQNGRESMSRSVLTELVGVDQIPDEMVAEVPFYENARTNDGALIEVGVTLCIDTDLAKEAFYLRPKAGEMAAAREFAMNKIAVALRETFAGYGDITVFVGSPT